MPNFAKSPENVSLARKIHKTPNPAKILSYTTLNTNPPPNHQTTKTINNKTHKTLKPASLPPESVEANTKHQNQNLKIHSDWKTPKLTNPHRTMSYNNPNSTTNLKANKSNKKHPNPNTKTSKHTPQLATKQTKPKTHQTPKPTTTKPANTQVKHTNTKLKTATLKVQTPN